MAKEKLKHGQVTQEDHFMEIRFNFGNSEDFVNTVNQKIEQGWKLVNATASGNYEYAFLTK
ncbi:MAG: hypothetical protein ACFFCS_10960 [Candidatus Hodarchaeota archaeon]